MIDFCNYITHIFGDDSILGYMEGSGDEGWNHRITLAYNILFKKPIYCFTKLSILSQFNPMKLINDKGKIRSI